MDILVAHNSSGCNPGTLVFCLCAIIVLKQRAFMWVDMLVKVSTA